MPTNADPVEFTRTLTSRQGLQRCGNRVQLEDGTGADINIDRTAAPNLYNVTLIVADTEYSQVLPANTKVLSFQCRTSFDLRFAFVTGKVATPTAPYMSLKADGTYFCDTVDLAAGTLYLASSQAGVVVEIEAWA